MRLAVGRAAWSGQSKGVWGPGGRFSEGAGAGWGSVSPANVNTNAGVLVLGTAQPVGSPSSGPDQLREWGGDQEQEMESTLPSATQRRPSWCTERKGSLAALLPPEPRGAWESTGPAPCGFRLGGPADGELTSWTSHWSCSTEALAGSNGCQKPQGHIPAVWPWASYFTSLSLDLLHCKMRLKYWVPGAVQGYVYAKYMQNTWHVICA